MAVTITKQPQGEPLNAYNNMVFEFTSTNMPGASISTSAAQSFTTSNFGILNQLNSVRAIVRVDNHTIELAPIKGKFYVNLKPLITMIFNQNGFGDNIAIPTGTTSVFRDTSLYASKNIHFKIILKDGTVDELTITKTFLKSVEQIVRDEINYDVQENIKLLLPYTSKTAYAAYWNETPFDVSLYSDSDRDVYMKNARTGAQATIAAKKGVNRIFFSNGFNVISTIAGYSLLSAHINELEFRIDSAIAIEPELTLFLERISFGCGTYLKWFNTSGGWSYWKFGPVEIGSVSSKTDVIINRDDENIRNAQSNFAVGSKSISEKKELKTGMMNDQQFKNVETILRSPKVYMLNASPYQAITLQSFKEVKVSDSTLNYNNKNRTRELKLVIDMPNQYAQNYAG